MKFNEIKDNLYIFRNLKNFLYLEISYINLSIWSDDGIGFFLGLLINF